MNVLAYDYAVLLFLKNLFVRIRKPYTFALRTIMGFNNVPSFSLHLFRIIDKYAGLVRQDKCLRIKIVLSWKSMLHFGQILKH
jgi:hypothetical protein